MTSRQRLLDTLEGRPTDRVPVAPFIFSNVVNERNGGHPADPIAACIEIYRQYGFDILLRNYIMDDYLDETKISCDTWHVEKRCEGDVGNNWDEITTITTPERTMTQRKSLRRVTPNEVVEAPTEYYIKEPEDFEQFRKYQPPIPKYDCSLVTHARELVGDEGLTGPWVHGVFNVCGSYRDLADVLADLCDEPEFFAEMMEYFYDRVTAFIGQVIDAGADFISLSGNMANGTMVGPVLFEEYVMPYEMRLIDWIHARGAKVIYHNCGDARSLLPLYNRMHIDMFESLTAPPYGDTDLEEALQVVQPPTALSGNIDQIHFLMTATPQEVYDKVRDTILQVKKRGCFVFACTDYLLEKTPEANLQAFADAAFCYGGY